MSTTTDITRAEYCVTACADIFTGAGEIMASPMAPVPLLGARLARLTTEPDLLITDLRMPGIDGFEMIRRLRADPQLQDLDIVVVSGLTEDEIVENGGLPADVILYSKPVPFRELKGYVQAKIMAMQRRGRAA